MFKRLILGYENDAIAVFFEQLRKKFLVHARAERTLEIIVVHYRHRGVFAGILCTPKTE